MPDHDKDAERRVHDRRDRRAGGRRASDPPSRPANFPACPACQRTGTAQQAGEADGGWWFVCTACDHLWDERARTGGDVSSEPRQEPS